MITKSELGKLLARHARRACLHPCMMNGRARKRGSGARGLAYHRIYINPVVAAAVRQKGGLGI